MNRRHLITTGGALLGGAALTGGCAMTATDDNQDAAPSQRRFAASIAMLFTEAPMLERFARAADKGFGAVEIQFPYDEPPDALGAAARAAGVEVVLINAPVFAPGAPMLSAAPGAEAQFHDAIATAKRYAEALGCKTVNVLPGDRIDGVTLDEQIAVYRANLSYAADELGAAGIRVVAEPINTVDRPEMIVATADAMAEVFDGLGRDDVLIQFDIYHVAMMGERPAETYARHRAHVGHIQFADAPGRHEPGTGATDFDEIFAAIDASGYAGWLGAEYNPLGATDESLGWLETYAGASS